MIDNNCMLINNRERTKKDKILISDIIYYLFTDYLFTILNLFFSLHFVIILIKNIDLFF